MGPYKSEQVLNLNMPAREIVLATKPHGLNVTRVLYRGYPDAALTCDTPVLTADGFKPASTLKTDDVLFSGTGKPVAISAIYRRQPGPVYDVSFKSGRRVRTSPGALWAPRQDSKGNITDVTSTESVYLRIKKRLAEGVSSPLRVFTPMPRPVEFRQNPAKSPGDVRATLERLSENGFAEPMPDWMLMSEADMRRTVVAFFADRFAYALANWEFDVQKAWNPEIGEQLLFLLRSLGCNVRAIPPKRPETAITLKAFTFMNLACPDEPNIRLPTPMDFMDEIENVSPCGAFEETVSVAPEAGTYNFIVTDFCVFHATLFSEFFDKRIPCMPWGTCASGQVPLSCMYPPHRKIEKRPGRPAAHPAHKA